MASFQKLGFGFFLRIRLVQAASWHDGRLYFDTPPEVVNIVSDLLFVVATAIAMKALRILWNKIDAESIKRGIGLDVLLLPRAPGYLGYLWEVIRKNGLCTRMSFLVVFSALMTTAFQPVADVDLRFDIDPSNLVTVHEAYFDVPYNETEGTGAFTTQFRPLSFVDYLDPIVPILDRWAEANAVMVGASVSLETGSRFFLEEGEILVGKNGGRAVVYGDGRNATYQLKGGSRIKLTVNSAETIESCGKDGRNEMCGYKTYGPGSGEVGSRSIGPIVFAQSARTHVEEEFNSTHSVKTTVCSYRCPVRIEPTQTSIQELRQFPALGRPFDGIGLNFAGKDGFPVHAVYRRVDDITDLDPASPDQEYAYLVAQQMENEYCQGVLEEFDLASDGGENCIVLTKMACVHLDQWNSDYERNNMYRGDYEAQCTRSFYAVHIFFSGSHFTQIELARANSLHDRAIRLAGDDTDLGSLYGPSTLAAFAISPSIRSLEIPSGRVAASIGWLYILMFVASFTLPLLILLMALLMTRCTRNEVGTEIPIPQNIWEGMQVGKLDAEKLPERSCNEPFADFANLGMVYGIERSDDSSDADYLGLTQNPSRYRGKKLSGPWHSTSQLPQ